ncbi:hypothetical protein LBMAG57_37420 [Verrucomicrobiota bacterium]|nr:hypothetical protein LBMAG57_37420 [Verrucomicrobiota bacterium]
MNYIGIDIHKKYCVLSALNEAGERMLVGNGVQESTYKVAYRWRRAAMSGSW